MANLKKIQKNFSTHLRDKKKTEILADIAYPKDEALARLNIYRNNVFSSFCDVLNSIFAVTKKILGEKKFAEYVKKYSQDFDSNSGNLDEYGEFFPDLFKNHKIKYLEDLARLELKYYRTYFLPDVKSDFDIEKFKIVAPEKFFGLTFELHPTLSVVASTYALYSIWEGKKSLPDHAEFMLIARPFHDVIIEKITEEEYAMLSMMKQGERLYDIYEELCKIAKKEIDIGALLNRFIAAKIIVGFKSDQA